MQIGQRVIFYPLGGTIAQTGRIAAITEARMYVVQCDVTGRHFTRYLSEIEATDGLQKDEAPLPPRG